MMTNNIKKYLIAGSVCCAATAVTTSCSDFLDILPMNEVVLENYWTEKKDVTSVVNSCYEGLENSDVITRMCVWGEMRSDNVIAGANVPNDVNEILKENLLPSNSMCNWSRFYEVINRCNTVCHYAPMVQAIDPNYTEDEMRANIAEVSAIRAICYFYLIRAFRDVPYSTEPSIHDAQTYVLPATPFEDVVDSLIADLEHVKGDAVRRYSVEWGVNDYQNSSRITRWAIYTLLADLYLWKGDWDNVIKYCDLVLDYKREMYEYKLQLDGSIDDIELFGDIPLLLEKPLGSVNSGHVYNEIFGSGNSFESIFELYFSSSQGLQNSWVNSYYGNNNNVVGRLCAPDFLMDEVTKGTNTVFKAKDCRVYESIEPSNSRNAISKYTRTSVDFTTQNISNYSDLKLNGPRRTNSDANWVLYRLSDVILMKAEAEIQKGEENYANAFALINTLNKRATNVTSTQMSSDTLKLENFNTSKADMEELLMAERQREFLFEGKRWFDLVRLARREGVTSRLAEKAIQKYKQDRNVIKIKLADPNYVYFPYAKSELKVNPLLKQNPAFNKGEDSELTK
jgi:hypothetical protein